MSFAVGSLSSFVLGAGSDVPSLGVGLAIGVGVGAYIEATMDFDGAALGTYGVLSPISTIRSVPSPKAGIDAFHGDGRLRAGGSPT